MITYKKALLCCELNLHLHTIIYYLSEWGINGNVVELPGHTNGSIGLEIEDDKLFESQNKIGNG